VSDKKIHLWGKYMNNEWEWIGTADEHNTKDFLMQNYRMAFGAGWSFYWSRKRE